MDIVGCQMIYLLALVKYVQGPGYYKGSPNDENEVYTIKS